MERFFQIDGIPFRLDLKDPYNDQTQIIYRLTHKVDTDGDEDLDDEGFPVNAQVFHFITHPTTQRTLEEIDTFILEFVDKVNTYLEGLFTVPSEGDVPPAPTDPWGRLQWFIEYGAVIENKRMQVNI